jgi:hypothetical protein
VHIDLFAVRNELAAGVDAVPTDRLLALSEVFRGEVLEGIGLAHGGAPPTLRRTKRMSAHRPVLVAPAARDMEITDNTVMTRIVRAMRRAALLAEIRLGPLNADATRELAREAAPGEVRRQRLASAGRSGSC